MLAVAVDLASPFIWAGAVVVVAAVSWVLSTATKAGIGDIVERKLHPLHKQMEKQERMIQSIDDGLGDMERRKNEEHLRIWTAIDRLRER